ncbi:MAG: hypothetical protein LBQ24_03120 [Candidatus Peribacteria bacterium]|nr:hypothetical protein [Candidatus Peribacteria bacterium]
MSVKSGASFNTHHLQTTSIVTSSFSGFFSLLEKNDEIIPFSFLLMFSHITPFSSIVISKKFIFFIKNIANINTIQIDRIQMILKTFFSFFTIFVFLKFITLLSINILKNYFNKKIAF